MRQNKNHRQVFSLTKYLQEKRNKSPSRALKLKRSKKKANKRTLQLNKTGVVKSNFLKRAAKISKLAGLLNKFSKLQRLQRKKSIRL